MAKQLTWEVADLGGGCRGEEAFGADGRYYLISDGEMGGASRWLGVYQSQDAWCDGSDPIREMVACACKHDAKRDADALESSYVEEVAAMFLKAGFHLESFMGCWMKTVDDWTVTISDGMGLNDRRYEVQVGCDGDVVSTLEEPGIDTPSQALELAADWEREYFAAKVEAHRDADRRAVLDRLVSCNGAVLVWQLQGDEADRFADMEVGGHIRYDAEYDLYVHPEAHALGSGGYTMSALPEVAAVPTAMGLLHDPLCEVYETFIRTTGLDLGSADEHIGDERLTAQQRAWLVAYSNLWDSSEALR